MFFSGEPSLFYIFRNTGLTVARQMLSLIQPKLFFGVFSLLNMVMLDEPLAVAEAFLLSWHLEGFCKSIFQ